MDETVAALSAAYCAGVDAAHPGALTALYLVGSVALGDYRPGTSDVDFIAVLDRTLSHDAITALHDGLRAQIGAPHFDGIYVPSTRWSATRAQSRRASVSLMDAFAARIAMSVIR